MPDFMLSILLASLTTCQRVTKPAGIVIFRRRLQYDQKTIAMARRFQKTLSLISGVLFTATHSKGLLANLPTTERDFWQIHFLTAIADIREMLESQ